MRFLIYTNLVCEINSEMVEIRIDGNDFGVGDGGQVDGLRGVQTTGVDQQLQRLQSNRRILTFGAGNNKRNFYYLVLNT